MWPAWLLVLWVPALCLVVVECDAAGLADADVCLALVTAAAAP